MDQLVLINVTVTLYDNFFYNSMDDDNVVCVNNVIMELGEVVTIWVKFLTYDYEHWE